MKRPAGPAQLSVCPSFLTSFLPSVCVQNHKFRETLFCLSVVPIYWEAGADKVMDNCHLASPLFCPFPIRKSRHIGQRVVEQPKEYLENQLSC